jgi:hypothetical protein
MDRMDKTCKEILEVPTLGGEMEEIPLNIVE